VWNFRHQSSCLRKKLANSTRCNSLICQRPCGQSIPSARVSPEAYVQMSSLLLCRSPCLPLPSTSGEKRQLLLALALSELVGNFNSEQTSPLADRSHSPDRWSGALCKQAQLIRSIKRQAKSAAVGLESRHRLSGVKAPVSLSKLRNFSSTFYFRSIIARNYGAAGPSRSGMHRGTQLDGLSAGDTIRVRRLRYGDACL
jgi:hypothetical protein